jgi:hypothetical protein
MLQGIIHAFRFTYTAVFLFVASVYFSVVVDVFGGIGRSKGYLYR